jgi:preprotein translocase subunit SecG
MGVKQTNDVLEKGTWLFAGIVGLLCIVSSLFFSGGTSTNPGSDVLKNLKTNSSTTAPTTTPEANQQPNTVTADSGQ